MAEPSRAEVLADLLGYLRTTNRLADAEMTVFTNKLFGVIDEWKSRQLQHMDAEAHCLAILEGLRPTPEELIPFEGVRSRLLLANPKEITVTRGLFQLEYREIQEHDVLPGTGDSAVVVSQVHRVLSFNTEYTVSQWAVGDTTPQSPVENAVPQFANHDTVVPVNMAQDAISLIRDNFDHTAPPLVVGNAVPGIVVDDTTVHSNVDENFGQVVQDNFHDTTDTTSHLVLNACDHTAPSDLDWNFTPLVQDNVVATIPQHVPRNSSPLSVRDRTPTPPSTLSFPPPLPPSCVIPHAQEYSDFSLPAPTSDQVAEIQGRFSIAPTVPTTRHDDEAQGHDLEADYDTAHLYDATPPRATRASPVPTPTPAAPGLFEDGLALDNHTVPLTSKMRGRVETVAPRRVTRASRAASNEPLWGTPNANSASPPIEMPPTPTASATDGSLASEPQQRHTNNMRERGKGLKVHFEPRLTRALTRSSSSSHSQSTDTSNTSSQILNGTGENSAPQPTKATAKNTTPQPQHSGPSANTRRRKEAEVETAPKVPQPVTKAQVKAQSQQPSLTSSSGTKSSGKQPTTKAKAREAQGAEVTGKVAAKALKAPKSAAKSSASQPEEPMASSSSRRPQVSGPASQLGGTSKPGSSRQVITATTGETKTREMTTTEVKKGGYWVFEHGSTKRRVKLYVLRCPNKDCKNPVFSRHPFKKERAAEHLRGCTNFRMENATVDIIITCFAYNVRSDHTSGPVTREWACRHNSTLIPKTRSAGDLHAENVWEDVEEGEDELAR